MRRLAFLLAAAPLLFPLATRAADPATVGEVDAELAQRKAEIAKEYEGAKMSHAQRREREAKEREAQKEVLAKHGVEPKDYERSKVTMNRDAKAEASQAGQAWTTRTDAEKKKASEPKVEPEATPIPVQRGFDEKNPVILHEKDRP